MIPPRTPSLSILLAALALGCSAPNSSDDAPAVAASPSPGELFSRHCTICHGSRGRADGEAARFLFPPARDFTRGTFRLVSTQNHAPLERDLVATLERGVPGTSMPAFHWLSDSELEGLARHVRTLATEGLADRLRAGEERDAWEGSARATEARAREQLTPDRPIPVLAQVDDAVAARRRGHEIYLQRCAACHAEDGSGTRSPRWNDDGEVNWARDFTAGYLKGGTSRQDLAHRILAGMPGSPMPATTFENPDDLPALVEYLKTLLPDGVDSNLVLRREQVVARRVESLAALRPEDPGWLECNPVRVHVTPLWWRDASIHEVTLSAIHDGSSLALRVAWPDATREHRIFSDAQRSDALALQFSADEHPPLFGMGDREHRTSIWHWKALRMSEVAGWMDLLEPPHLTDSERVTDARADAPVYHRLEGLPAVSAQVERIEGQGIGAAQPSTRQGSEVEVSARPTDEGWEVIFVRSLRPSNDQDITFATDEEVQMAIAVWNGAAGDQGPQKSISIWQGLRLEP